MFGLFQRLYFRPYFQRRWWPMHRYQIRVPVELSVQPWVPGSTVLGSNGFGFEGFKSFDHPGLGSGSKKRSLYSYSFVDGFGFEDFDDAGPDGGEPFKSVQ
jgi:hypothetical protein